MTDTTTLIQRLSDEADLCRNDGATDIAKLLDDAVYALVNQRAAIVSANAAYTRVCATGILLESQRQQAYAQIAALRADAERYRWLRIQDWFDGPMAVVVNPKDAIRLGHDAPSRDRLDAAIDVHVAEVQGLIDSCVAAALRQEGPKP